MLLVAEKDGQLLGLVHYLFHRSTSMIEQNCYLQDLFVSEGARGLGAGAALIDAVRAAARPAGASRVYWLTQELLCCLPETSLGLSGRMLPAKTSQHSS